MRINGHTINAADFVPAAFIGSPVAFILAGVLHKFIDVWPALAIGAAGGLVAGLAVISAVRRG